MNIVPSLRKGADSDATDALISHTLRAGGFDASEDGTGRGTPLVASVSENQRGELLETDYAHQLSGGGGKPGQGYAAARVGSNVRRLTPTECERLQGFPDGWTIPYDGAIQRDPLPDGPRYAAMGDAVTVPVIEWIGHRLARAVALPILPRVPWPNRPARTPRRRPRPARSPPLRCVGARTSTTLHPWRPWFPERAAPG